MVMSFGGLLVFALLMALIQNAFDKYLNHLKKGHEPVIETQHTLIIGFTPDTIPLVQELCAAHAAAGIMIVILSEQPKSEVEDVFHKEKVDLKGSQVVVRMGHPHRIDDLAHVSTEFASHVILMPNRSIDKELRDAFMIQALVSIRGSGWPLNGRILSVCSLMLNRSLFEKIGGDNTEIIMLDVWVAKLMVTCAHRVGLGAAIGSLFSLQNSSFYPSVLPAHLVDCTFGEASLYYSSVVIGVISASEKCLICPGNDYVLAEGDTIVTLAENETATVAATKPVSPPALLCSDPTFRRTHVHVSAIVETVLILGWNENIGVILLDLDNEVAAGSRIVILSNRPVAEREAFISKVQARWQTTFRNLTKFEHVQGNMGSRYQLDELPIPVHEATRVIILCEQGAWSTNAESDACTITATLQIREIFAKHKVKHIPIVSEIKDASCETHCHKVGITDFVNSSLLPAQMLATITHRPILEQVMYDIISTDGTVFVTTCAISEYMLPTDPPPTSFNFWEASALVAQSGDVLLGWSVSVSSSLAPNSPRSGAFATSSRRPSFTDQMTELFKARALAWDMNPKNKVSPRRWNAHSDMFVVISPTSGRSARPTTTTPRSHRSLALTPISHRSITSAA